VLFLIFFLRHIIDYQIGGIEGEADWATILFQAWSGVYIGNTANNKTPKSESLTRFNIKNSVSSVGKKNLVDLNYCNWFSFIIHKSAKIEFLVW